MRSIGRIIYYSGSAVVGLSIPIFFAYIDMWELEIETSMSNLWDMLKSQNIYVFSAAFFPLIFCIVSELIHQVRRRNLLLKQDFEYLKVLLNATPDAIIFLDENKNIIFQNNQFKILFKDFKQVIYEARIGNYFEKIDFIQREVTIPSTITESHPFMMSFKLATFNEKKNYFISFKDLKNLKDKEKIIEDQKHQMIEKNKLASLGEMAAGIAHEINNPLTVIHSNNAILQKLLSRNSLEPDKVSDLAQKTRSQVERITEIITSLRNLSRGLANDEKENFYIDQVLEEAINLARIKTNSKRIEFKFQKRRLSAYGNRGQIVQVILNLLNNAIDAVEAQKEKWIEIELKERGHYVDVYITDSGKGINEDIVKKIFLPMYTTKDVGKGTGLGLSLSRNFIEQNSGTLEYVADKEHTCFKVALIKSSESTQQVA